MKIMAGKPANSNPTSLEHGLHVAKWKDAPDCRKVLSCIPV